MLLPLNLQFFAEESTDGWDFIDDIEISDDDQPEQESEETVEETEEVEEVTEDVVEPDSDEESDSDETDSEEEETEESEDNEEEGADTELSDETEISLGEDKQPVTLKELKDGYLRQSDYTKKTQALAEDRKAFEAEKEEYEPIKEWTEYWSANPYLKEQIMNAINEWENTGVLPIEQVLQESSSAKYINHLIAENKKLKSENDKLNSDVTSTKFESEFNQLTNDLKAEYGELANDEYFKTLRDENEGLSVDVLKRIAEGELAKKQLEQEKQNSKKAVAKAKQKQKSKRLPPQPKQKGQTPKDIPKAPDSWEDFFGVE